MLYKQLLDQPPNDLRPEILNLIRRLSAKSRSHPECFVLQGVEKFGDRPKKGGTFGDVWKGKIENRYVAIKIPRIFEDSNIEEVLKDFSAEPILWRQLCHPNILPFHGIFYSDSVRSQICLVSPWMEEGNIREYLKKNPTTERMPLVGCFDFSANCMLIKIILSSRYLMSLVA